ncbi:phage antirepressor KilAC domain-containing protein [Acetobacteraceae bacterium B3987]|nr:phage antirepressor KilAC domain-containing protein [Acetobacteraceae bacterium B3987]
MSNTTTLTIAATKIRQDAEGRYRLNDCHKAAGSEKRHGPSYWLDTEQAQSLARELTDTGIPVSPISVKKGGLNQGTYVCRELVYAYAMWISPAFHLHVIRAFDDLVQGKVPSPAANYNIPATKAEALRLAADLEDELVIVRPKAAALDYISQHAEDIGVRDMGRELHVGQNALVAYLLEHKWACRDGKGRKLKPAHYGLSNGYTRLITTTYTTSSGEVRVTDELRITAKGRTRLAHIFSNKGEAA